jgi:hypothetical protein
MKNKLIILLFKNWDNSFLFNFGVVFIITFINILLHSIFSMNAKDAIQLTDKSYAAKIAEVETAIRKAANEGKTEVDLEGSIFTFPKYVKSYFTEKGFKWTNNRVRWK